MQDFLFQLLALLKVYQLLQSFGLASDCLKHVETISVGKNLPFACPHTFKRVKSWKRTSCISAYSVQMRVIGKIKLNKFKYWKRKFAT